MSTHPVNDYPTTVRREGDRLVLSGGDVGALFPPLTRLLDTTDRIYADVWGIPSGGPALAEPQIVGCVALHIGVDGTATYFDRTGAAMIRED